MSGPRLARGGGGRFIENRVPATFVNKEEQYRIRRSSQSKQKQPQEQGTKEVLGARLLDSSNILWYNLEY